MHVLLIDDDTDDIELFGEALAEADVNARFQYFFDGSDLMKHFEKENTELPDIIFLDINMSTISGWDCLAFIKKQPGLSDVPVIMYSTSSYRKEIEQALQRGATGFLTKPTSFKALIQTLKDVLSLPADKLKETLKFSQD